MSGAKQCVQMVDKNEENNHHLGYLNNFPPPPKKKKGMLISHPSSVQNKEPMGVQYK